MNKDQYNYDKIVQARNREAAMKKITRVVTTLDNKKKVIHIKGQTDKIRNNRNHTLFEYRESLDECKKRLRREQRKLKYLKTKHQPPKSVDNTDATNTSTYSTKK